MFRTMSNSNNNRVLVRVVLAVSITLATITILFIATRRAATPAAPVNAQLPKAVEKAPAQSPKYVAPDKTEGSTVEYRLRWGKVEAQSGIPLTGGNSAKILSADMTEGSAVEYRLRYGNSPKARQSILTVNTQDFGYNYWLVVGPAGEKPMIQLNSR